MLNRTTDGFLALCEEESGQELDWFFEVYLRRADLPELSKEEKSGALHLRWRAPDDLPFPMPLQLKLGDEVVKVAMEDGEAVVPLKGEKWQVDPDHWVLRKLEQRRQRR